MNIFNIFNKTMPRLKEYYRPSMGCDPEFFFSKAGKIIGSEKVMPEGGIIFRYGITALNQNASGENKIVIDGVQAEMNPLPAYCREALASNIRTCFQSLKVRLSQVKGVKADFSQLIEVSQKEMDSLSGSSKVFGCMPSFNPYEKSGIHVNPEEYRFRSAGGHIHLGHGGNSHLAKVLKDYKLIVPLMDIIVGNTCVLIDRDPGNVERRKVYGRAGEHRKPKHGVEYRTLSNFWLRSYPLMSFVMGLSRLAVSILAHGKKYYEPIMKAVDIDDIRKAINENDFELALKNFAKIEPLILAMTQPGDQYPLNDGNIDQFKHFIKMGIDHFFPEKNIISKWVGTRGYGWENFLAYTVHDDMLKTRGKVSKEK